jgi:hypothetical protein
LPLVATSSDSADRGRSIIQIISAHDTNVMIQLK